MTLTKYILKLGLSEPELHRIIEAADKGMSLGEIKKEKAKNLSERQIYAILVKYCIDDGAGEIDDLYPNIYSEFVSKMDENSISKNIVISKNNKQLAATYEDLNLKEREANNKAQT